MNFVFVDESGDPGKSYKIVDGKKVFTGASKFYVVTALPISSVNLFSLEQKITGIKHKYGFKKEIKSTLIPLKMYKDLLKIINILGLKIFYRIINKETYKGTFAVDGKKRLHNIFDEYNLVKTVLFTVRETGFIDAEIVIDRADRRLLDGTFDNFDNYLTKKVNTKTIKRVKFVTHVNSEYVYLVQMSNLVCGVIKDYITGKNKVLKQILKKGLLRKVW